MLGTNVIKAREEDVLWHAVHQSIALATVQIEMRAGVTKIRASFIFASKSEFN